MPKLDSVQNTCVPGASPLIYAIQQLVQSDRQRQKTNLRFSQDKSFFCSETRVPMDSKHDGESLLDYDADMDYDEQKQVKYSILAK